MEVFVPNCSLILFPVNVLAENTSPLRLTFNIYRSLFIYKRSPIHFSVTLASPTCLPPCIVCRAGICFGLGEPAALAFCRAFTTVFITFKVWQNTASSHLRFCFSKGNSFSFNVFPTKRKAGLCNLYRSPLRRVLAFPFRLLLKWQQNLLARPPLLSQAKLTRPSCVLDSSLNMDTGSFSSWFWPWNRTWGCSWAQLAVGSGQLKDPQEQNR